MKILKNNLEKLLKNDDRLWDDENKILNETLLKDLSDKLDEKLIELLLSNPETRKKFFLKVKDVYVFKNNDFKFFLDQNKIDNSFTNFKNIIGLSDGKKFLKDTNDVVLNWPYKDCVLEGGQSTEEGEDNYYDWKDDSFKDKLDETGNKIKDGRKYLKEIDVPGHYEQKQAKRKEIFFNEVLAQDEIDRLFDEKALVNWKRFTKDGEQEIIPPSVKGGRGIFKRDKDGTIKENLIIKGNNLLALHSLKKQFAGKVKLIYIDPPYNTGNDGFKYNDNFNHSTWLTFIRNRLEAAKTLLKNDGSIWINIDDREAHYLKILGDEIFGRENFVANVIWQKKYTIANDAKYFSDNHDHVLIFAKNKDSFIVNGIERTDEQNKRYSNPDNDSKGPWMTQPLHAKSGNNTDFTYTFKNGVVWIPPRGTFPRYSNESLQLFEAENSIWFGKDGNAVPRLKKYLSEMGNVRPATIWSHVEAGNNDQANKEIKALIKSFDFATPKPEKLLQRIIHIGSNENDIILDFFAGSGTTAAVAHKMKRHFITTEQMDYIETVTVERLKKVIGIEKKEKDSLVKELEYDNGGISKSVDWQGGGEFIYFELAKWNEKAKAEILACKNLEELEKLFETLYEKYFLNYNLKIKDFKEKVIKEDEFINLALEEQKKMFLIMLDLNQMYVQKTEMSDKKYAIEEKDQKLTEEFYKN